MKKNHHNLILFTTKPYQQDKKYTISKLYIVWTGNGRKKERIYDLPAARNTSTSQRVRILLLPEIQIFRYLPDFGPLDITSKRSLYHTLPKLPKNALESSDGLWLARNLLSRKAILAFVKRFRPYCPSLLYITT